MLSALLFAQFSAAQDARPALPIQPQGAPAAQTQPQAEATPAPTSQADRDFQAFQDAQKIAPPKPYREMNPREVQMFMEERYMAMRNAAVVFLNEHPTDPRRWSIVNGLSPQMPRFVLQWGEDNAEGQPEMKVDEAAAQNWKARVTALKTALNDAEDLPGDVRKMMAARAEMEARRQAFFDRWRDSGEMAPDFATYDLAGSEVKLSDYRGKVVVLDFWASWCGPCKAAFPHVQDLASQYKKQGVVVLAAGTSDARADFEKFVRENQDKYPDMIWTHDKAERGDDRASKALYDVMGIPTQFVIDREGKVVDVVVGYSKGEVILDAALAKAGIEVPAEILAQGEADLKKRGS
jgi:thiol-disulfide isomerase/thioredoxin